MQKLNINLKSTAVEENDCRYEIPCEYSNACGINKNVHGSSTRYQNVEILHEEGNANGLNYCCYQNVPFCCESETVHFRSETEVYNKNQRLTNPYENIGIFSGNNQHDNYSYIHFM